MKILSQEFSGSDTTYKINKFLEKNTEIKIINIETIQYSSFNRITVLWYYYEAT